MPVMICHRNGKEGRKCGSGGHCFVPGETLSTGETISSLARAEEIAAGICAGLDESLDIFTDKKDEECSKCKENEQVEIFE